MVHPRGQWVPVGAARGPGIRVVLGASLLVLACRADRPPREADPSPDPPAVARAAPPVVRPPPSPRLTPPGRTVARLLDVPGPGSHPRPAGTPAAVVHAPPGVSANPWLVVFLHGWSGCARGLVGAGPTPCGDPAAGDDTVDGWDLGGAHEVAGLDTVMVVPQLAWRARETSAGRLREPGFARELLTRAAATAVPGFDLDRVRGMTLVAHSAGYEAADALLTGDLGALVRDVVLFDALYGRLPTFEGWVTGDPGRRLVAYYTGDGTPWRHGRRLLGRLRTRLGPEGTTWARRRPLDPGFLGAARYALVRAPDRHADVPRQRLAEALRALAATGVSPRPRPRRPAGGSGTAP